MSRVTSHPQPNSSPACGVHPPCPACPEPRGESRGESRREPRRRAGASRIEPVSCTLIPLHSSTLEPGPGSLTPLDRTLTKNAPASPLESALTKHKDLKSPRIILLQKRWGEGTTRTGCPGQIARRDLSPSQPLFFWPLALFHSSLDTISHGSQSPIDAQARIQYCPLRACESLDGREN